MRYFRLVACAFIMLLISAVASAQQDFITNFAGGGPNNVPALSANLNYPGSTATDNAGNYYIVAGSQERVFKVDTAGTLTVVAGNGFYGYGGDGGPARQAELNLSTQSQVAVDSSGNVFIADTGNCVIREVTKSTGIISTFAGTPGSCGFGGDGGSATASGAYLYYPYGLAVDSAGNVYVSDTIYTQRIRKVDTSGIINTVAGGNGYCGSPYSCGDGGSALSASLGYAYSLAVDGAGNVFIPDLYNSVVRELNVSSGNISLVAGAYGAYCSQSSSTPCGDGGPATSAGFYYIYGIASDPSGNLFIADFYNYDIREVVCADSAIATCTAPSGQAAGDIYTVAGTGGTYGNAGDTFPATSATLGYAYGISVDSSDNIFIPNYYYYVVREAALGGNINTVAGNGTTNFTGNNIQATDAVLNQPWGVAFDSSGNAYIADRYNQIVRKVDTSGVITVFAGTPGTPGFGGDGGSATAALLYQPFSVATDSAGNVYIADYYNLRIRKVDTSGNISTFAGNGSCYDGDGPAASHGVCYPEGVATDSAGNVYIAESGDYRIRKVDTSGNMTTIGGDGTFCYYYYYSGSCGDGGPATSAHISPTSVAVDSAGNVYFTEQYNYRVRRINPAGIIDTFAGNGSGGFQGDGGPAVQTSLYNPQGVAVDPAGNVIIADTSNQRIRLVDGQGLIHTIAGNGTAGFSGAEENVLATTAELYNPSGVGVDAAGNIYIADSSNNLVRQVSAIASVNASRYNINFGIQPVGKVSGAQGVTFSVGGPLVISGITTTGPFTEGDNCAGISSGETCVMYIYFKSNSSGTFTGTVQVASNAFFGSPLTINLTGRATSVSVSPTSAAFGNQASFTLSKVKNVKITNKGTTPITLGTPSTTGDFLVVAPTSVGTPACGPSGSTLAAGTFCYYGVAFKPRKIGPRTGALIVNTSDGGSPQFVTLTGTGVGNGGSVSPTKLAFGAVTRGTSVKKTVTVTNNTPGTMTLSSPTITGAGALNYSVASGAVNGCGSSLAGLANCTYDVTFSAPSTPGALPAATLNINDSSSAGSATQTVALSGSSK